MSFDLIAGVLLQGLRAYNNHQARKYLDRVVKLRLDYLEEFNRPDRSQLHLDRLCDELRVIAEEFSKGSWSDDVKPS